MESGTLLTIYDKNEILLLLRDIPKWQNVTLIVGRREYKFSSTYALFRWFNEFVDVLELKRERTGLNETKGGETKEMPKSHARMVRKHARA